MGTTASLDALRRRQQEVRSTVTLDTFERLRAPEPGPRRKSPARQSRLDSLHTLIGQVADTFPAAFTIEGLIVAAWRAHPNRFGLRGHEDQFPDSNRVIYTVCGRSGAVARGILERIGPRLYRRVRS